MFNLFIQFLFSSTPVLSPLLLLPRMLSVSSRITSVRYELQSQVFQHEYELRSSITTARLVLRSHCSNAALTFFFLWRMS